MERPLTAQELRLWLAFLYSFHTISRRLADDMHRVNRVSVGWYDVLVNLYHAPAERLRMQDLAESVLMSSSGLTRLLDRMIEEGLVRREHCAEDRRVIFAVLTDEGRALLEEILPQHQQRIREYLLEHLTEEEVAVMTPALERVLATLREEGQTLWNARLEEQAASGAADGCGP
ncbi:MAG: MarR family transcriptional regulator [Candidatus Promineifilaceae bacterium]|nr:MarR family transcriptional regulator [Candidatus Promineifilaceae bacterium]